MKNNSLFAATQIDVLNPSEGAEWDRLVLSHPDASFFHAAAWARVICQTYRHRPLYFSCATPGGELAALVPLIEISSPLTGRRGVCLPFSDFCGPLVFTENGLNLVEEELRRVTEQRAWKYFEIRGGNGAQSSAETAEVFYGHKLNLAPDVETTFARFGSSTKGAIRQALKSNLNVEVMGTRAAVEEFYRLHLRTRRRHGIPPQPLSFFMNIYEFVVKAGLGFVVLAREGVQAVAGAIFFRFGRQAIYKFAASDPSYGRSRGNNLVLWQAIKHFAESGVQMLHFGRTVLSNEGLRRFKLSWGAEEEKLGYYRFDAAQARWIGSRQREGELHKRIFQALPLAVNRLVGTIVYPHLD